MELVFAKFEIETMKINLNIGSRILRRKADFLKS
jgi:hypothetical protein